MAQALWDIKGKGLGAPVYQLLGGKVDERIKLYKHIHFLSQTLDEFATSTAVAVALGYEAVKFDSLGEAHRRLGIEEMRMAIERVQATREAVGPNIDILTEGHGRPSPDAAIRVGRLLEEFELFFFEEPVPPENPAEMAKIATSIGIPIAAGECLYTRWAFRELLEQQVVDYVQPDLRHCDGFLEGYRITMMAETYHVRVMPHNPNGPISTLVGLHLGACTANFEMPEYPRRPADAVSMLRGEPEVEDGHLVVPEGPGWGVELDEEVLTGFEPEA